MKPKYITISDNAEVGTTADKAAGGYEALLLLTPAQATKMYKALGKALKEIKPV